MEEIRLIPLIIVGFYLVGLVIFGIIVGKFFIKDSKDYMLAGRRMGIFMVGISLAAVNIGGGSTVGVATRAFSGWGLSAAWFVLAASVAMIPISYFAPRIRRTMAYTIPEIIYRRFGVSAGISTAVLSVVSLFLLTSSQVVAASTILSALTGLPFNISVIIAISVILIYTCMGGMTADMYSDVIQFCVLFIGLLISIPFILNGVGGYEGMVSNLPAGEMSFTKIGWTMIISLIINYFCTFLSGPEMMARVYSAEDEKKAQKGALLSAVIMACVAFIPTIIGLAALSANPDLDGGTGASALIWAATTYTPDVVIGFVAAAIISATMSSADSNLICASTIIIKDIYQKHINKNPLTEKRIVMLTRTSNVCLGILAACIALFRVDIITMNIFAFALRSAGPFAAYVLGIFWAKSTPNSGLPAILMGSVVAITWQIMGVPFGVMSVVVGAAASTLTFVLITTIESKRGVAPAPAPNAPDAKDE